MLKEAIYHQFDSSYAYAVSKDRLLLKLRAKKNDLSYVKLIYMNRYEVPDFFYNLDSCSQTTTMQKVCSDHLFDYYEAVITVGHTGVTYYFELRDREETLYYGNYSFFKNKPTSDLDMYTMNSLAEKDIFHTPEWAREAIGYQIFVERFFNGDPSITPPGASPWDSQVNVNTALGGDLAGIIQKLDYLEELGVNLLYLTPIFQATSCNHKYDTVDYFKIDPQFGTLETLKELVEKAHAKGIRIILDGVFNHVSHESSFFRDVIEKGKESHYYNWFDIYSFPLEMNLKPNYACFGNLYYMPKLMTKNKEVSDYFLNVARYWIEEADIDGWRADCASEIDHRFWREFREVVKKAKPDAIIISEIWSEANAYLQGDQFDSTMNYQFARAVTKFIAEENVTTQEFDNRLRFLRGLYKKSAYDILWNHIDSHDTPRFLTCAGECADKLKLAALIQLTYTGIPAIYYGDEVGMSGSFDPDNRRGMIWEPQKQNLDLLAYYKKLIAIRKKYKVLRYGDLESTYISDEKSVYGYLRQYENEVMDVLVNNSRLPQKVQLHREFSTAVDCITGMEIHIDKGALSIELPPLTGVLFRYA
ncbi:MAG: alpha-glycosidase [Clostridia bacterium]|nr:alpha-glycosidase [Clostridia bacterium]